jgi:predicted ferric reductase
VLTAAREGIRWHRWGGMAIIAMVVLHVGALYAYSPEDVMDALLLVAPTPFSLYGVIGLWCVILTGVLAAARRRLRFGHRRWRIAHSVLAVAIVSATAVHAVLIEGAMEEISKLAICLAALATTTFGAVEINILGPLRRRRAPARRMICDRFRMPDTVRANRRVDTCRRPVKPLHRAPPGC